MRRGLLPAILFLLSTSPAPSGQPVADHFVLPADLEITLWAESPMFFNPTNIDVDARGRVWVAEAVNYRGFNTAKAEPLTQPAGDRIVILSDSDGDGRADSCQGLRSGQGSARAARAGGDWQPRRRLGVAAPGRLHRRERRRHAGQEGDPPDRIRRPRSRPRAARARRRPGRPLVLQHRQRRPSHRHRSLRAGRFAPAACTPAARPTT